MSQTHVKEKEMLYGIYFADTHDGFNGPKGERQAGCVISENQSDEDIIKHLINADFCNPNMQYEVLDYNISIHVNYSSGKPHIVLLYEEDFI